MPTEPDGKEAILAWWIDITELKKTDRELREKLEQLARFRRLAVGRESKMIALKKEINEFLNASGNPRNIKFDNKIAYWVSKKGEIHEIFK
jgi:hypothetical protein